MSEQLIIPEQQSILGIIANAANDANIDPAKMSALLDMQLRILAVEREKSFNESLARLQAEMPKIPKRGKVDFTTSKGRTNYSYERYEDIDALIRPLMSKYGFSYSCVETEHSGTYRGTLLHKDGHSKDGWCTLPPDATGNKNAIQALGSASSYAKRIIIKGLLNVITIGEDDDAQAFSYVTPVQAEEINSLLVKYDIDKEKFLKQFGVESLSHIAAPQFETVVRAINERNAKKALKEGVPVL